MIGNSWWSESTRDSKAESPRITISISGEPTPPEGVVDWTTPTGKPLDISEGISNDVSYIGRCVGKQLYISDVDERKKKVEALIKVVAPGANSEEKVIGTFLSRPIKVISKPSKKRQSAKNLECE
jgi:recombining binding protein (suppressor of hairless)